MSFSLFDKNPFHGLSYWGAYIINEFFPIFKTIVPCQLSFFKSLQKNSAKCVAFFLFMCLLIYKEKSSCDLVTIAAAFLLSWPQFLWDTIQGLRMKEHYFPIPRPKIRAKFRL